MKEEGRAVSVSKTCLTSGSPAESGSLKSVTVGRADLTWGKPFFFAALARRGCNV